MEGKLNLQERTEKFIGQLVIANASLSEQVEALQAQVIELTKQLEEKK